MLKVVGALPSDVPALLPGDLLPIRLPTYAHAFELLLVVTAIEATPWKPRPVAAFLEKRCTGLRFTETGDLAGRFEYPPPTRQRRDAKSARD